MLLQRQDLWIHAHFALCMNEVAQHVLAADRLGFDLDIFQLER